MPAPGVVAGTMGSVSDLYDPVAQERPRHFLTGPPAAMPISTMSIERAVENCNRQFGCPVAR